MGWNGSVGAPPLQTTPPVIPEETQSIPESVWLTGEPILNFFNVECWILNDQRGQFFFFTDDP